MKDKNLTKYLSQIPVILLITGLTSCGPYDIPSTRCDDIRRNWTGDSMPTVIGIEAKILKISNVSEISRSDTRLVCDGTALLSQGGEINITMEAYEDSDGDRFYRIQRD